MINVTKNAAEKFNEVRQKSGIPENKMLRVYFAGRGWGGPRFELTLDEFKKENDKVVELEGVKVVFASELETYLKETVIDYSNNWFNRGFTIAVSSTSSC